MGYLLRIKRLPIVLPTLTMIEANNADQKLLTEKPSKKEAANIKSPALIIKINSPSVTMEIGKVRITKTGRTTALRSPSTIAAMMAT